MKRTLLTLCLTTPFTFTAPANAAVQDHWILMEQMAEIFKHENFTKSGLANKLGGAGVVKAITRGVEKKEATEGAAEPTEEEKPMPGKQAPDEVYTFHTVKGEAQEKCKLPVKVTYGENRKIEITVGDLTCSPSAKATLKKTSNKVKETGEEIIQKVGKLLWKSGGKTLEIYNKYKDKIKLN